MFAGAEFIDETYEMQSEITKTLIMEVNHQTVRNVEDQKGFGLSPARVEHLHEEANGSFKHSEKEAKVDANVDLNGEIEEDLFCPNGSFKQIEEETKDANIELIGEVEEDLMDLDVEGVLEKQNTHDLYCPNCNSCITKTVILVRRKPKVSLRHKPKRGKKPDPIPPSAGFGVSDDTPEIHSDPSPAPAPDEQDASREQEQKQEAFSCLSCFSLFIPIGITLLMSHYHLNILLIIRVETTNEGVDAFNSNLTCTQFLFSCMLVCYLLVPWYEF